MFGFWEFVVNWKKKRLERRGRCVRVENEIIGNVRRSVDWRWSGICVGGEVVVSRVRWVLCLRILFMLLFRVLVLWICMMMLLRNLFLMLSIGCVKLCRCCGVCCVFMSWVRGFGVGYVLEFRKLFGGLNVVFLVGM